MQLLFMKDFRSQVTLILGLSNYNQLIINIKIYEKM